MARFRSAASLWTCTKSSKSFTLNMASAVSTTRHTTTEAISMGFPVLSFTLSLPVSKFRTRAEILVLEKNGLAQRSPGCRAVPTYLPKSWSTLASFGFTRKSPTNTRIATKSTPNEPKSSGTLRLMEWMNIVTARAPSANPTRIAK